MSPVFRITARRQDRCVYRVEADSAVDAAERVVMEDEVEPEESENLSIHVVEVADGDGKEVTPPREDGCS